MLQLFMIPELREGVLKVEGAATKEEEDGVDVEEKSESENIIDTGYQSEENRENDKEIEAKDKDHQIKKYQVSVLNQIQFIFGHLAQSQLQFHVPQGFWKTFKWVSLSYTIPSSQDMYSEMKLWPSQLSRNLFQAIAH